MVAVSDKCFNRLSSYCYNRLHYILGLSDVFPNFLFNTSETMREYQLKRWYIRFASRDEEQLKTKLHRMIAQCPDPLANRSAPPHMKTRTSIKYPANGCRRSKPMYRQPKHKRPHRRLHPKTPTALCLYEKINQFL